MIEHYLTIIYASFKKLSLEIGFATGYDIVSEFFVYGSSTSVFMLLAV
jgi:hypothetical protein